MASLCFRAVSATRLVPRHSFVDRRRPPSCLAFSRLAKVQKKKHSKKASPKLLNRQLLQLMETPENNEKYHLSPKLLNRQSLQLRQISENDGKRISENDGKRISENDEKQISENDEKYRLLFRRVTYRQSLQLRQIYENDEKHRPLFQSLDRQLLQLKLISENDEKYRPLFQRVNRQLLELRRISEDGERYRLLFQRLTGRLLNLEWERDKSRYGAKRALKESALGIETFIKRVEDLAREAENLTKPLSSVEEHHRLEIAKLQTQIADLKSAVEIKPGPKRRAFLEKWALREEKKLKVERRAMEQIHRDGLEELLGYKFSDHQELLTLLPRHHKLLKADRREMHKYWCSMAELGRSVLKLTMHDLEKRFDLALFGKSIGLERFIIDYETGEPMEADKLAEKIIPVIHTGNVKLLPTINAGIWGVIFRDGGIDAIKFVLGHTHFIDHIEAEPSRRQDIGITAYKVLKAVSSLDKKPDEEIRRRNNVRWSQELPRMRAIANAGDLGAAYREGGLASAKEVLNSLEEDSRHYFIIRNARNVILRRRRKEPIRKVRSRDH